MSCESKSRTLLSVSKQNRLRPVLNLCQITLTSDSSRVTHTEIQSHKQEKLGRARTQDSSQLQTQRVSQWDPVQV